MKKTKIISAFIISVLLTAPASQAGDLLPSVKIREYYTKTKDGWRISLMRYTARAGGQGTCKGAVVLCHGFNFNNIFWDLDTDVSLARYLAFNGYDVWAPSLRGSGYSSKPVLSNLKEITRLNPKSLWRRLNRFITDAPKFNWTIDDHIEKDVPAVIEIVRERSGFDRVFWAGHSMGGIIMFDYLAGGKKEKIAGFIPIGSMIVIPEPLSPQLKVIADQERFVAASLLVNTRIAADLGRFTLGIVKYPIEDMLINRENMSYYVMMRLYRDSIEDASPGVVRQFSRSLRAGAMISRDGRHNYTSNLDKVDCPILILAGGDDAFVTESSVKICYNTVGSSDKEMVIFSKANGYTADYGHCDVVLGKNSREEVYPVILKWLDERR